MPRDITVSIISALIAGLVTFLFTLALNKRKEKREDNLEARKLQREAFQNRPEMQITDFKDYITRPGYGIKQKCDIDIFVAHISSTTIEGNKKQQFVSASYCEDDFDTAEWCCVIYTLKNVGKTAISALDVICHFQRTTCIFPSDSAKQWADGNMLNYAYCYDRKIREGNTITLKFCYHKDAIVEGTFSAMMSIGMVDDNGRHWIQPLFTPRGKMYDSRSISEKEYYESTHTEIAEKCFKKPWLW